MRTSSHLLFTLSLSLLSLSPSLRVWEKLQARMQAVGATVTGVKRVIADWAKSKGLQGNRNLQNKYIFTTTLFRYCLLLVLYLGRRCPGDGISPTSWPSRKSDKA